MKLYEQGRASGDAVDYAAFEERVARASAKVEQDVHQVALSGLDVDVPFIRVWGKHYRRVHRIARTYGSLGGPVIVERTLYRELGQRQGPVSDPIAVRAGVVDGSWLPRTARAIAHLVSQVTSREADATGRELMRLQYSRSSIERVAHAVGAEYLARREQVEPKLPLPSRGVWISICALEAGLSDRHQSPIAFEAARKVPAVFLARRRRGLQPSVAASQRQSRQQCASTGPNQRFSLTHRLHRDDRAISDYRRLGGRYISRSQPLAAERWPALHLLIVTLMKLLRHSLALFATGLFACSAESAWETARDSKGNSALFRGEEVPSAASGSQAGDAE